MASKEPVKVRVWQPLALVTEALRLLTASLFEADLHELGPSIQARWQQREWVASPPIRYFFGVVVLLR